MAANLHWFIQLSFEEKKNITQNVILCCISIYALAFSEVPPCLGGTGNMCEGEEATKEMVKEGHEEDTRSLEVLQVDLKDRQSYTG